MRDVPDTLKVALADLQTQRASSMKSYKERRAKLLKLESFGRLGDFLRKTMPQADVEINPYSEDILTVKAKFSDSSEFSDLLHGLKSEGLKRVRFTEEKLAGRLTWVFAWASRPGNSYEEHEHFPVGKHIVVTGEKEWGEGEGPKCESVVLKREFKEVPIYGTVCKDAAGNVTEVNGVPVEEWRKKNEGATI